MPFPVRELLGYVSFGTGSPVLRQIAGGLTGLPRYPLDDHELVALRDQGWDERLDPEPHCLACLVTVEDRTYVTRIEYVNPHHNID